MNPEDERDGIYYFKEHRIGRHRPPNLAYPSVLITSRHQLDAEMGDPNCT